MTQAFNLSQFANKLNSSGQTDNTGLQNSSVTVTAGSGMSGGGAVALGGSVTLNNAGVTSLTAGSGISLSGSTGAVTITNTSSATGTVTSVATGNGLQGGTITTSGTLSITAPAFNSVGSYVIAGSGNDIGYYVTSNYSGGNVSIANYLGAGSFNTYTTGAGTWRCLGAIGAGCPGVSYQSVLLVRIS